MNTDRGDVVRPCVPPFMRPVAQGPRVRRSAVGPFPVIAALVACGLLLAAFADQRGRAGRGGADTLFWIALATVIAPPIARVVARDVKRLEALGLVVLTSAALYAVKVLKSPLEFVGHDELGHWRTTSDILATHHLFRLNPLIDTFGVFPGLASVTSAVASTAGVSIFHAGLIVVGAAKVVSVVALFLIYEQLGGSARLATVATLAYALNPNYLFFDASFSYESLALPLAGLVLLAALRRERGPRSEAVGWTVLAVATIGATVATHHMTAFMLAGFLVAWTAIRRFVAWRTKTSTGHGPGPLAAFAVIASVLWVALVASVVVAYLVPVLRGAVLSFVDVVTGQSGGKAPFSTTPGQVTQPLWQRGAGFMHVGLVLFALPFGLFQLFRWFRRDAFVLMLGLAAGAYPATLALRFTRAGTETSNRASEFVFVGIAFVLALAIMPAADQADGRERAGVTIAWATVTAAAVVTMIGGSIIADAPYGRIPGRYLVVADERSVEPEGVDAALWAARYLPADAGILTDRINGTLLGSYGRKRPILIAVDGVSLSTVITAPRWIPQLQRLAQKAGVRYIVVDRRLTTGPPLIGYYFDRDEPGAFRHEVPLELRALTKFDRVPGFSRVFDSGNIAMYAVPPPGRGR